MEQTDKPSLLLHACCAPCITHPIKLLNSCFQVTAFFYNPNIHPSEEYMKREREISDLAEKWNFPLILGKYDSDEWFERVKGLEQEPEGGARCRICFDMRLDVAARKARALGFKNFATTLSISPHKNAKRINEIGTDIGKRWHVKYHEADFKKKDGFKISCRLSEEEGLYRQTYCGCIFSQRSRS